MKNKEKQISAKEAAAELHVTEQTIRKWLTEGDLKGYQVGKKRKWFIPTSELLRFKKEWGYEKIES